MSQVTGMSTQATVTQETGKGVSTSKKRVKLCVTKKKPMAKKTSGKDIVEPIAKRTRLKRQL